MEQTNVTPRRGPYIGKLDTVGRVRREVVRLYRLARRGEMDVVDASKLANVLLIAVRMLEGQEVEARLAALERAEPRREPWRA